MATYVIGDIHGWFNTLQHLLRRLDFDPDQDRLWLVGDLVNRGPDSLGVLRWAQELNDRMGERMVVVLGNHDLHLLALRTDIWRKVKEDLTPVLEAPDTHELLSWLASRPLLHREGEWVLVHAGLLPDWTPDEAEQRARHLESLLRRALDREWLLASHPHSLSSDQMELRWALEVLTRIRTCRGDGRLCHFSGPPEEAPEGCLPWYRHPNPRGEGTTVIFGHWAAQGLRTDVPGIIALDSGCAWGGPLSALRLDDRAIIQQERIG